MADRDLTTDEVARRFSVSERTVRLWCKKGHFQHAYTEKTPFGAYWKIPEKDLEGFEPRQSGRPPKPKAEKSSGTDGKVSVKAGKKRSRK